VRPEAGSDGMNEGAPPSRIWWAVLVSVGGSCPHIAVEAEGHDGDDRHDEDFHGRSLLGPGVVTADETATTPALLPHHTPEPRNMQSSSRN
jgi:hypothetical protein